MVQISRPHFPLIPPDMLDLEVRYSRPFEDFTERTIFRSHSFLMNLTERQKAMTEKFGLVFRAASTHFHKRKKKMARVGSTWGFIGPLIKPMELRRAGTLRT